MGICKILNKAKDKANDKIAKLSSLSPEQLTEMSRLHDEYLSQMPDPTDIEAQVMTERCLSAIGIDIYQDYLPQIDNLYVPLEKDPALAEPFNCSSNIRYFKITKWVTDKNENSLEKLVSVYESLADEDCNIALIFHRRLDVTDVYLGIVSLENRSNNSEVTKFTNRIRAAIKGNFPGSECNDPKAGIPDFLNNKYEYSVASVSNVPTEKSEKFKSQTIEKLLDGLVPEDYDQEYTLMLLATPVQDVNERKLHLSECYTGLAPYSGWSTGFAYTQSDAINASATFGVNAGVSAGIQNGQNQAVTKQNAKTQNEVDSSVDTDIRNSSKTDNVVKTQTDIKNSTTTKTAMNNVSDSFSENTYKSDTTSLSVTASIEGQLFKKLPQIGISATGGKSWTSGKGESTGFTTSHGNSVSDSIANGVSKSLSEGAAKTVGEATSHAVSKALGKAVTNSVVHTNGISKAVNFGGNFGANFARSSNVTATVGKNEDIRQNYTNYTIKHTLEILEEQMKRLETGKALGLWDFAAYVLSEDPNTANNVAHSYLALTQGEKSYITESSINFWRGNDNDSGKRASIICNYLRELRHPVFGLNPFLAQVDGSYFAYPTAVTATTELSGKELAYSLNFPSKSVSGLPVLKCAEFGRNVTTYNPDYDVTKDSISIGTIFHMNHSENVEVALNRNSLTSHVFVTGSTGSGKSNTVYEILNEAEKKDMNFLVIEPAKGEYKNVFGGKKNVNVYGTNPRITSLLRIDPFSFPKEIHVFEHMDRLVEIFNVCWPMYAAMPAVLKAAVQKSYEDCGWNLLTSENPYGDNLYPCFADVAKNIKEIIDSSDYDSDNKGAYKGSLLTRLQSLTNGINGMIFTSDELSSEMLFDSKTIVDLSRVGSSETKSLLMGMLVLKLQEYRMSKGEMNAELNHITVLEEAHNLLKRTSTAQPVEGGNLLGKSVEMLANAIAEMRTYGESFIIVDQAPGLLDRSVIRNTNTKIIMRLPDQEDRELVGKAANLNEDQIAELAKLPCGVGAVYQNEWTQPVLCKINLFDKTIEKYSMVSEINHQTPSCSDSKLKLAELISNNQKTELKDIKSLVDVTNLQSSAIVAIYRYLENPPAEPRMTKMAPIMSALFPEVLAAVERSVNDSNYESEWTEAAEAALKQTSTEIGYQTRRDIIQAVMTQFLYIQNHDIQALKDWGERGNLK